LPDVSEMLTASIIRMIALMMEAVSTSEMCQFLQTTWHNIPKESHLHTHHCENLKYHLLKAYFKLLSHHSSRGTEENKNEPQSRQSVSQPRCEMETSRIQVSHVIMRPTCSDK
jgi:hypothetical protein